VVVAADRRWGSTAGCSVVVSVIGVVGVGVGGGGGVDGGGSCSSTAGARSVGWRRERLV